MAVAERFEPCFSASPSCTHCVEMPKRINLDHRISVTVGRMWARGGQHS